MSQKPILRLISDNKINLIYDAKDPRSNIITTSIVKSENTINSVIKDEKINLSTGVKICIATRICNQCNVLRNIDQFKGNYKKCNICRNINKMEYRNTLNGAIKSLYGHSISHSKERGKKGRIGASEHLITEQDIYNQYLKQNGKCIYSNIVMSYKALSDWMMSLERIDDDRGYIKENITLSCHEFNCGRSGWNKNKIKLVLHLRKVEVDMDILTNEVYKVLNHIKIILPHGRKEEKYIDNLLHIKCTTCNVFCVFIDIDRLKCSSCRTKISQKYRSTLKGFLMYLTSNAKNHFSRIENSTKQQSEYSITLEDICNLIIKQKGKCYYSNIPMVYKPNSDWLCSIERLDNSKGYILENIVLICNEFNTSDKSYKSNNPFKTGSSQWSKQKIDIFIKSLEEINLNNENIVNFNNLSI